jgi:putative N6-adenine-specific DNA methylase
VSESLFIATSPGLEQVLLPEARTLGEARLVPGGVRLRGPAGLHRRANLLLRCASRVWIEIASLRVDGRAALRRAIAALDLSPYVAPGATLEVEAVSRGGLPERDLLAAGALAKHGALRLRAEPGVVVISIDTSGELLHRRGYRQEGSRAPLRETLAAGLLALANHRPEEPLWDPLCGSGTLVIEAALLSRGLPPGLQRTFAFERFPAHDAISYAQEKAAAIEGARAKAPAPIWASDLNAGALGTARRNARRAGAFGDLKLFRHDATKPVANLPARTLVLSNLPYGKRVGGDLDLPDFYRKVGEAMRRSGAHRVAFLAAHPSAATWLGFEGAEVHPVDNGGLSCRLVVADL